MKDLLQLINKLRMTFWECQIFQLSSNTMNILRNKQRTTTTPANSSGELDIELSISNRWLMTFEWKCSLKESKHAITCLGNCFCFVWRFTNLLMTQNVRMIVSFTQAECVDVVHANKWNSEKNEIVNEISHFS